MSGEIRLAWLHRPGHPPQAIRGGSVSGTVCEACADLRLVSTVVTDGSWHGPAEGLITAVVAV